MVWNETLEIARDPPPYGLVKNQVSKPVESAMGSAMGRVSGLSIISIPLLLLPAAFFAQTDLAADQRRPQFSETSCLQPQLLTIKTDTQRMTESDSSIYEECCRAAREAHSNRGASGVDVERERERGKIRCLV